MWRIPLSRAAVLYFDVICDFKHSCGMITDTNIESFANVKRMLTVKSQCDTTLLCTSSESFGSILKSINAVD